MSTMTQSAFLDIMEGIVREQIAIAREDLVPQSLEKLLMRPSEKRWNALECLAHLNSYADYYLPKFELAIHRAKARKQEPGSYTEIGWLGNYCARSVDPERRLKSKMRTPKRHNYIHKVHDANEIKKYITYQEILLRVIARSREIDINAPKVKFQTIPFLKMNLASFLQFLVQHERRHMLQAQEALSIPTTTTGA
jgi:uncharacterized damage-inducible protein DinB